MKICYSDRYNFNLGPLGLLHAFDMQKFRRVYETIKSDTAVDIFTPPAPLSDAQIGAFMTSLTHRLTRLKRPVLQALEFPHLPLLSMAFIDKKVLTPMRWGAAGTLSATREALNSGFCWNLSGGYHHAGQRMMEGFCIYNDIGICHQSLVADGTLSETDKVLIVDTDAHHGNGNAETFMENPNVTLLDVYNQDIYPTSEYTRGRVDYPVPLPSGTKGAEYLEKYEAALDALPSGYKIAFVVAGTDVLAADKLGGLKLSIADVIARETLTLGHLKTKADAVVMLTGGGYSKESADAISESILANV